MKKALVVVAIVLALFAGQAYANYCARDVVPAATLLVPYAQQGVNADLTVDPQGKTTIFGITNVSKDAQIVHITLWNMYSEHVVDFDIILTGYDIVQMNMRDVLNGDLDLLDASGSKFVTKLQKSTLDYTPFELGPDGRGVAQPITLPNPQDRDVFAKTTGCNKFPYQKYPTLASCWRTKLEWPLRSVATYTMHSNASGANDWLSVLAPPFPNLYYYITADVVKACSTLFPDGEAYWTGQYITGKNVLIGDVIYFDAKNNYSESFPAQHIEWDGRGVNLNNYYQRYESPNYRSAFEPLATAFAVRFQNDAAVKTNLWFWKDANDFFGALSAKTGCDEEGWQRWEYIDDENGYAYYSWDMDEYPKAITTGVCPVSPCPGIPLRPNVLPYEVQSVAITSDNFDLAGTAGWLLFILPPSYGGSQEFVGNATMGWAAYQFTYGTFSSAIEGAIIANANCFPTQVLPQLGINYLGYVPMPTE